MARHHAHGREVARARLRRPRAHHRGLWSGAPDPRAPLPLRWRRRLKVGGYASALALLAVLAVTSPFSPLADPPGLAASWEVRIERLEENAATSDRIQDKPGDRGSEFVVVWLSAAPLGEKPEERFPWWRLELIDSSGARYSPDTEATRDYASQLADGPWEPGQWRATVVAFAPPASSPPFALAATDGSFVLALPTFLLPPPQPGESSAPIRIVHQTAWISAGTRRSGWPHEIISARSGSKLYRPTPAAG